MFFNQGNHEVLDAGYEVVEGFGDYFTAPGRKEACLRDKALGLIDSGYKVIVAFEDMSIVGDEGWVILLARKEEGHDQ